MSEPETGEHPALNLQSQDSSFQLIEPQPKWDEKRESYKESACTGVCLSSRLAKLTVIATLLVILILVISLDVTILEVERVRRNQWYVDYAGIRVLDVSDSDKFFSLVLKGSPGRPELFESIENPMDRRLVSLELDHVELNIQNLYRQLEENWNTEDLERLVLTNVSLSGQMLPGYQSNIRLHQLKTFVLKLDQSIGPGELFKVDLCDNCVLNNGSKYSGSPFDSFEEADCFLSLIFFTRYDFGYTKNVFDLEISISITLQDWAFFKLDFETGEIISMVKQSNEILKDIPKHYGRDFVLKKLSLKDCELEAETLGSFSGSLTHLILDTVNITGLGPKDRLSSLLRNFGKLEQLTLKNSLYPKYYDPAELARLGISRAVFERLSKVQRPVLDLEDFPITLKNLSLSDFDLIWTSSSPNTSSLNFNLDHLAFHHVAFLNASIVTNFRRLFQVRKLGVQAWVTQSGGTEGERLWAQLVQEAFLSAGNESRGGLDWVFVDLAFLGSGEWVQDALHAANVVLDKESLEPEASVRKFGSIFETKSHPSYWEEREVSSTDGLTSLWFDLLNMDTFMNRNLALTSPW